MGFERVRVDDGGYRVGGVVEAVHELEPEGDEQRDPEQDEREDRRRVDVGDVGNQLRGRVDEPRDEHSAEDPRRQLSGLSLDLGIELRLRCPSVPVPS